MACAAIPHIVPPMDRNYGRMVSRRSTWIVTEIVLGWEKGRLWLDRHLHGVKTVKEGEVPVRSMMAVPVPMSATFARIRAERAGCPNSSPREMVMPPAKKAAPAAKKSAAP